MQAGFSRDEELAIGADRRVEQLPPAAAGDRHALDRLLQIANRVQAGDVQELLQPAGDLAERKGLGKAPLPADSQLLGVIGQDFQRRGCRSGPALRPVAD